MFSAFSASDAPFLGLEGSAPELDGFKLCAPALGLQLEKVSILAHLLTPLPIALCDIDSCLLLPRQTFLSGLSQLP